MLEGWPSFTAPSVLSHCLGVIAWRSKDSGVGSVAVVNTAVDLKVRAAGGCRTAMLPTAGFPEG